MALGRAEAGEVPASPSPRGLPAALQLSPPRRRLSPGPAGGSQARGAQRSLPPPRMAARGAPRCKPPPHRRRRSGAAEPPPAQRGRSVRHAPARRSRAGPRALLWGEKEQEEEQQTFSLARERASGSCGGSPGPRGLDGARLLAAKANHQRARLSAGRAAAPPGRGAGEGAGSAAPRGRAGRPAGC